MTLNALSTNIYVAYEQSHHVRFVSVLIVLIANISEV